MPTLPDLLTKRAQTWDAMQTIIDEAAKRTDNTLSAEERASYDKAEKELDDLTVDIERLERHGKRAESFDKIDRSHVVETNDKPDGDDGEARYAEAFDKFFRFGMEELGQEERQLVRSGFRPDSEMRAQSVGTNTAGGYLVPAGYRNTLIETMKAYGDVISVAEVLTTDTGNTLPWPTNDDTANEGALLAENTQDSELDLVLGQNQLDAYKYTSKITRASVEFIQDVAIDAEGFIARKHGERIGRITNRHFTVGTGTAQPQGIVTGATSGVTAAGVAAITADELIDLQHSVDPAYRNERSAFMLSDTALKSLRKLKDSNGLYLWQPNVQAGQAPTLLGSRYIVNQHMAVPATGVKSVLYGDFRAGYVVRIVRGIQAVRFAERYMDYFQVGFVSFARMDGAVQDANAYKALTQA